MAKKGHIVSLETRKKISDKLKLLGIKPIKPRTGSLTEEHKRKISIALKGENSPHWIKDRSLLKTGREKAYDTKYKYWMLEVKNRDGWKCKIENDDCLGDLEAHHILGWRSHPELRYEINNGITLCHFHHPRKRLEEQRLIPYFQSMVEVI